VENFWTAIWECDSCKNTEAMVEQKLTKYNTESVDEVVTYWKWTSEYKKEQVETTFRDAKKELEKQLGDMKCQFYSKRTVASNQSSKGAGS